MVQYTYLWKVYSDMYNQTTPLIPDISGLFFFFFLILHKMNLGTTAFRTIIKSVDLFKLIIDIVCHMVFNAKNINFLKIESTI